MIWCHRCQLSVFSARVQPDYWAAGLWSPLLQERGLAIARGSGNERYGLRSASTELQKPSASDNAVLRDRHPSVGRPFAWVVECLARSPLNFRDWSAASIPEDAPFPC